MWDLSCPDWAERLAAGRSLIPDLPLFEADADLALAIFEQLQLPDVPDLPYLGVAAGQWFKDLVRAVFGSWDPVTRERFIRDFFVMAPKGSSKTSYSAGLMLTGMLVNKRPRGEMLFVGPTQAISDRAYEQAVGMIEASPDLKRRFRPRDHLKTIEDLVNLSELKVKTFDLKILTGSILIFALIDELHLLGRNAHTAKVLRQIRGGLDKTPEGALLITTTQSDEQPAGAFKEELHLARKIRDGEFRGKTIRSMLPMLFEYPPQIARDQVKWQDPEFWPLVMPNLGLSVHLNTLIPDWESEKSKGEKAIRVWASQHLNIEIGIGLRTDAWPGAEFWESSADDSLTFETLLERCEVVVIGLDGGGLDDLFGLTVIGRETATKIWLSWSHAWCHRSVLTRRQTIAPRLLDFEKAGDLTIVEDDMVDVVAALELPRNEEILLPQEQVEILALVQQVNELGLLNSVAIDNEGPYGELIDGLVLIGVTEESEQLIGVGQGYRLMNAIKTSERKLANRTFRHAASPMMDWCVGNVKIEPTATAIRATKQNAGDLKIDPVMALFDAATVMTTNPEPKTNADVMAMVA